MTTYSEAVEQTITAGEQIHQIVNGTATTEVTVEDGSKVPSIRKALLDNFYFKDPIAWQVGQTENVFNQLRQFTDGSWWYAPSATASNPISMGSTPVGDSLWKIYDFDAIGKLEPRIDEALRRSYAEAGYNVVGTFRKGFTYVNANDIGIDESTGKGFSGPAGPVAAGTDPTSGGFVDRSDDLLNNKLSSDSGGLMVSFKISGVAGSVKRTIGEALMDGALNVKWLGAVGDWDMGNQTGADDTAAVQACIDELAIAGSRRVGGTAKLYFPTGHYRLSTLTIPASLGFGIDIVSDGMNSSYLWFDHTNTSPAIVGEVEFIHFRDMSLMGSLSDQNRSNSAMWKQVGIKGKQPSNYPDIDIRFTNCQLAFFQDLVQVYGRGCVFDNCNLGFILNAMHIVADPATVFTPGSTYTSLETGMRHYTFRGCRFDVVSRAYKISGSGAQKEHINNILCVGNDFSQCDVLIDGPDATIRRAVVVGNTGLYSFATGVVQVKSGNSGLINNNNFAKEFNDSVLPDSNSDCISSIWASTGGVNGLQVHGNVCKNLRSNAVTILGASSNVSIVGNDFPQAWTFPDGTNHFVFYSPVNCDGLLIKNNSFQTSNINGSYFLFDASVQTSRNTRTDDNISPWSWADSRLRYTPRLLVAGTPTAGAYTSQHGRVSEISDTHVTIDIMLIVAPSETTGNLSLSLPPAFPAVAENATITGRYSGHGTVAEASGFSGTTLSFAPMRVNPSTQQAEIWLASGPSGARAGANLTPGLITLNCTVRYRYQ